MTTPESLITAPLWRRLIAMFYDGLLLAAIWFVVGAAAVGLEVAMVGADSIRASHRAAAHGLVVQIPVALATYLFYGLCWTRSGQTLGMKTWHLKLISTESEKVSWRQSAIRLLVACASLGCLGAGYWWALFDREGASWHDRASRSRVVQLPK